MRKTRSILYTMLISAVVLALGACNKPVNTETPKYVEVYDTIKEAFLTDKGFSEDLSKHMTKDVNNSSENLPKQK